MKILKTLTLLFTVSFLISSCKEKAPDLPPIPPAGMSTYVFSYTSGMISRNAPIVVQLAQPAINESEVGQEIAGDIISFKPSIEGSASWTDRQTITFIPENPLPGQSQFTGKVNLKKLFADAKGETSTLQFAFKTPEQQYRVEILGQETSKTTDYSKQLVKGVVYLSDAEAKEPVEKMLVAKQDGQKLPIKWSHQEDGVTHYFTVADVKRLNVNPSSINLEVNGNSIDVNQKDKLSVDIPASDDMRVLSAKVLSGASRRIQLNFSDPIQPGQDLEGLISIEDFNGDIRYEIDGNNVYLYPTGKMTGEKTVKANAGILNTAGKKMFYVSEYTLVFEDADPGVRLVGDGVILPNSDGLLFPFEAINLSAVDVEIFKIYNNNILQFLQFNALEGDGYLDQVGRIVMQKRVDLHSLNPQAAQTNWESYALNLQDIFQASPNTIYKVRIGFKRSYSNYACPEAPSSTAQTVNLPSTQSKGEFKSIMDWPRNYRWRDRDNPCKDSYYTQQRFISRTVVASNLGIIAKMPNPKELMVAVTDLRTTAPLASIPVEVFDFQQQKLGTLMTDTEGIATQKFERKPAFLIAKGAESQGYLRLFEGNSLSLSRFDISGTKVQEGLKGVIYGERGVWRPGDSLYLNFVLHDDLNKLPDSHPIEVTFFDPRGNIIDNWVTSKSNHRIYPIHTATSADAQTGNWRIQVEVGGLKVGKTLKIETVKPNRFKFNFDIDEGALTDLRGKMEVPLQVQFLHGAPANSAKTKVEMQLKEVRKSFKGRYDDFVFSDPSRKSYYQSKVIFNKQLNSDGRADVPIDISKMKPPSALKVNLRTATQEPGGGESVDQLSFDYDPYLRYVGLRMPRSRYGWKRLEINKNEEIRIVVTDTKGNPMANETVTLELHKGEYRWWYDDDNYGLSNFNSNRTNSRIADGQVTTNAKGEAVWQVKALAYGRYFIQACLPDGHCTGDFAYGGYPWYNSQDNENREAAAMLLFSADKDQYNTGETVNLKIPSSAGGRALVSIEDGNQVLSAKWQKTEEGMTTYSFKTTPEMAPNVYAHVTLIQPHGQDKNDLPIRMYGVIPINVEDPNTHLKPILRHPGQTEPEKPFKVTVSEENGQAMAYTLAVVDEGLLGLTRFQVPNLHKTLYSKEALGIQTWDIYDQVLGAEAGRMQQILSMGGDAALRQSDQQDKANRFKPVVQHIGPFFLKKGQKVDHEFTINNYIGEVRVMVVAANNGAYGKAQASIPVKKDLMVLPTLPRVLGPDETFSLPVTVFTGRDDIQEVQISVESADGFLQDAGAGFAQQMTFAKKGEQQTDFQFKVAPKVGVARLVVNAKGGGLNASQSYEIQVRNPNPYETKSESLLLESGKTFEREIAAFGSEGTNSAVLEISRIPSINIGERLHYLIRYPHGCLEQTTSAAFPQLYAAKVLDLDEDYKKELETNVSAAIQKLQRFQASNGAFNYWPGERYYNNWSNNYAGHFLIEAKRLGFSVPNGLYSSWLKTQQTFAKKYEPDPAPRTKNDQYLWRDNLSQAYRLYTLALASKPEMGAMNRLREAQNMNNASRYYLAAAYALSGRKDAANELLKDAGLTVDEYKSLSGTFGSNLRDRAILLNALTVLGRKQDAAKILQSIAKDLNSNRWYNTQATGFSLMAVGYFLDQVKSTKEIQFTYQLGNEAPVNAGTKSAIRYIELPISVGQTNSFKLTNSGEGDLYAKIVTRGQPLRATEEPGSNDLKMTVKYLTMEGKALDISTLEQGTDFLAQVTLSNPGNSGYRLEQLALTQTFPSGWEIVNKRLSNVQNGSKDSRSDYQDYRDDRVLTYLDLYENNPKSFTLQLNAAYLGTYYLPAQSCEAMYDNTIYSRTQGQEVQVIAAREQ